MSEALALYDKISDPVEAIQKMGAMFARSGMFACAKDESGMMLAMICLCERKSPTDIMRTYDIVDGKLRKKAMGALAEFRAKGGKVKWLKTGDEPVTKEDDREAKAEFTFEGQSITVAFTLAQARLQGLVREKSNWVKTPANMLRARVVSNAVGMLCPEIYSGDVDEVESTPQTLVMPTAQTLTVTSAPVAPPAKVEIKTVEVEVVKESKLEPKADETALAEAGLAPAQTAAPGELSEELTGKVQDIIGANAPLAIAWFRKQNYLAEGQGIQHLKEAQAMKIINQAAAFLRAIGAK